MTRSKQESALDNIDNSKTSTMFSSETSYRQKLGTLLRKARKSVNMTQQEVATHFELSQDAISKYESGKTDVNSYRLLEFSKLYQKPITFFFMDRPHR